MSSKMTSTFTGLDSYLKEATTSKGIRSITQQFKETVGAAQKTVDVELQLKVKEMKDAHHDLRVLAELVKGVSKTMSKLTEDSLALSACFDHLSGVNPEAKLELDCHHRVQDVMSKNALCLVEALSFFQAEILKFIDTEIKAAHDAVAHYEKTRVEYDACRLSFESLKDTSSAKLPAAEAAFLESYNTLSEVRSATWTKLCECDTAKVAMFKVQLKGLSNAVSMYLSGNTAGFEDAMSKLESATTSDEGSE